MLPLFCLRRSACSLARASRSALKFRLCGLAATTFSSLGAAGVAGLLSTFASLAFGATGFASALGAGAGLKLAAICSAALPLRLMHGFSLPSPALLHALQLPYFLFQVLWRFRTIFS